MGAVRADRELQLEKQFGDGAADIAVAHAAQLSAQLAELRGPERERSRETAIIRCEAVDEAVGGVDAHTGEKAASELVVGRGVEALQRPVGIAALVGDGLDASDEGVVKAALRGLPAVGHVESGELIVNST